MSFLEDKENTIQSRLEKTKREFNNIRQQTADGENKTISPTVYQFITDKMNKILKTLAAESKQVSPLMKMTEIEKQIELAEASI
jgi:sugar-specific transcriptional regulator TrmB